MEENTVETTQIPNEETQIEETTNDLTSVDALAAAYDYYDRYYEKVLENMKTINDNQSTIIVQQEDIINEQKELIKISSTTLFVIAIILIYTLLRNMIRTR